MHSGEIAIYVATHKKIELPLPEYYHKMQVNAEKNGQWEGYLHDNDGENISLKNESYCELTVLYSLWKNCDAEIKGLVHYRRFFGSRNQLRYENNAVTWIGTDALPQNLIREEQIREMLQKYDVILTWPLCPYPTNAREDLQRFCYRKDIAAMMDVVQETMPEYLPAFARVFASEHLSYCNMLIGSAEFVDGYCAWLFPLLRGLEERVDLKDYDTQHKRIFGYLAEVLLNVYVVQQQSRVGCCQLVNLGGSAGGMKSVIRACERSMNLVLARAGVFPYVRRHNRSLWKTRYERLQQAMAAGDWHVPAEAGPCGKTALIRELQRAGAVQILDESEQQPFQLVTAVFDYGADNIEIMTAIVSAAQEADRALAFFESLPASGISSRGNHLLLRLATADPLTEPQQALCETLGVRVL